MSGTASSGGVRASDAERERAASALRAHYGDGRLDDGELERRLELAYTAVTRRDLRRLFSDLPRVPPARRWLPVLHRALLTLHTGTFLTLNGGLVGAWAAMGGGPFWPAVSLVPGAALLAWHGAKVRSFARQRWLSQAPAARRALR